MIILAPSILSADFGFLSEQIEDTKRGGAQYVHMDVMDGVFVPNISFGMPVIQCVRRHTDLFLDAHLMVTEPERIIPAVARAGADMITFHLEATKEPEKCIRMIREAKKKVGISIKPATPVEEILPFLHDMDMLLIMTVEPGFGGQSYIEASTEKIRKARALFTEHGLETDIQVDGGIKLDNIEVVLNAGANVIVAGSSVYKDDVYGNTKAFTDKIAAWQRQ